VAVSVKAGTRLTIVLGGRDETRRSFDPVRLSVVPICTRVSDALRQMGAPIAVNTCDVQTPALGFPEIIEHVFSYPYTGTWRVTVMADYAEAQHVAGVLAGAAYQATGFYPGEVAVTNVSGFPTGTPGAAPPPDPAVNIGGLFENVGTFLETLSGSLWLILLLLIGGIVLVLSTESGRGAARLFL
jgi:hypothetical protein